MWWDGLIAGLLVATAALWLVRRAVRRIQRTSGGCGCGSTGCPLANSGTDRSVVRLRELVQVNLDVEGP